MIVKDSNGTALADGQAMGIVKPGDPSLYATFTIGALKEVLVELAMTGRSISREQLVAELYGLLESGYLRIGKDTPAADVQRPTRTRR